MLVQVLGVQATIPSALYWSPEPMLFLIPNRFNMKFTLRYQFWTHSEKINKRFSLVYILMKAHGHPSSHLGAPKCPRLYVSCRQPTYPYAMQTVWWLSEDVPGILSCSPGISEDKRKSASLVFSSSMDKVGRQEENIPCTASWVQFRFKTHNPRPRLTFSWLSILSAIGNSVMQIVTKHCLSGIWEQPVLKSSKAFFFQLNHPHTSSLSGSQESNLQITKGIPMVFKISEKDLSKLKAGL